MNELPDINSIRDQVFNFIASRVDCRLNKLQALQFTNDRTLDYVREKIDHFSQELNIKNVYAPPPKHPSLQDELKGYFKDLKEGKIPPTGQTDDEETNDYDSSEYVQEECSRKPKLNKNRSNAQLYQEKVHAGVLRKDKSTHLIYKTEGLRAEKSFHENNPKRTGSKVQSRLPEQKIERDKSKPSLKKLELNDSKIRESLETVNNRSTSRLKTRKQDGNLIRNSSRKKIAKNFETNDISMYYLETASTERERVTSKKIPKTKKEWNSGNKMPNAIKKGGKEVFKKDTEDRIGNNIDRLSDNRTRVTYNPKREKLSVPEGTDYLKRNELQDQNATQKSVRSRTPVPRISGIEEANRDIRLRLERTPVKKKKSSVDQNESPEQNTYGSSEFETKKNEHRGQVNKPNKQHNIVEKSVDQKVGKSNSSDATDLASEQKTRQQDNKCKNPEEIGAKIMTPCFSGAFHATLIGAKIELGTQSLDKSKSKNPMQAILSAEERLERGIFSFDAKEMENENLLSSLDKIEENMSYNEFRDEIRAEEEIIPKKEFIPMKSSFESSNASVPSPKKARNFSSTSSSRKRKLELDIEMIEKDAVEGWEKHSATQEERDEHDAFVNGDYDPNDREEYTNRETLQTEQTKNDEDDNVNENHDFETLETEPLVTEGFDAEDTQENEVPNNSELDNGHAEEDPREEEFDPNDSEVDPNKTEQKEQVGDHSYCRENLIQEMKNPDHKEAQNEFSSQEDIASKKELQEKQNNYNNEDLNQSHSNTYQILTSKNIDENKGNIQGNTETQDPFSQTEDPHNFCSEQIDIVNAKSENTVHALHDTNQEQAATKDNSKQSSVVDHGNLHEDFPESDLPQDKTSKIEIDPSDIILSTITSENTQSDETKNKLPTDMIDKADKLGGIGSHSTLFENKISDSFVQDDIKSLPNHETINSGVIYEHDSSKDGKEEKKEFTAEVSEENSEVDVETSASPDKKDKKVYVVAKLKSNKRITIVKPPAKKSADQE